MSKEKKPVTPAVRFLKEHHAEFDTFNYDYEEKGGTRNSAEKLNVDEYQIIKTLIFSADGKIICVLMHGNCEVSTKELARFLNVKTVEPCDEKTAFNHTGYKFGGTSPFGVRKQMNVYIEKSILSLNYVYINGGKQGFLVGMKPTDIKNLLNAVEINTAIIK